MSQNQPTSNNSQNKINQALEVAADYENALKELTFNSKPIINNLTIIAKENVKYNKEIVRVIENRIRAAPPEQKLPVLYLLDSIAKNVGGVFITEFSKHLVLTFCRAFEEVKDHNTRIQYLKLLKTWPQFFPPEKVQLIEQRLRAGKVNIDDVNIKPQVTPQHKIHVNPLYFQPQKAKTITPQPPPPTTSAQQKPTAQQTKDLLIRQLQTLLVHELNKGQNALKSPVTQKLIQQVTKLLEKEKGSQYQQLRALLQRLQTVSQNVTSQPVNRPYSIQQPSPSINTVPPAMPLYTQPPVQTMQPTYNIQTVPLSYGYGNIIPQQPKLPRGVDELYNSFGLQCSNCGLRFRNQEDLGKHLDRHFQMTTKRANNKVLSRKWFQTIESYMEHVDHNVVESPGAIFFNQLERRSDDKDDTKDKKQTESVCSVVADENQEECPVCSDKFETFWDSSKDEWMYKDAIKDPTSGIIVHKSCAGSLKRPREDLSEEPNPKRIKH